MTISNERLAEIAAEYRNMLETVQAAPHLEDAPGAASAFYMSCSLAEIMSMATELHSLRTIPRGGVGRHPAIDHAMQVLNVVILAGTTITDGNGGSQSSYSSLAEQAKAAWSALSTIEQEQEPSGWLINFSDGSSEFAFTEDEIEDRITEMKEGEAMWKPLYLSPSVCEGKVTEEMVERAAKLISPWAFEIPEQMFEERFSGAGPWPEGEFYIWDKKHAHIVSPNYPGYKSPWPKLSTKDAADAAASILNQRPLIPYLKEQGRARDVALAALTAALTQEGV
jgi:hypothetical protein